MMDIQYKECACCYSLLPDDAIFDGLCEGCAQMFPDYPTQDKVETDAVQKLLSDIVKADEILSATAAGRSTGYQNCSEGIASTAATVDMGHSEMDGGYMK